MTSDLKNSVNINTPATERAVTVTSPCKDCTRHHFCVFERLIHVDKGGEKGEYIPFDIPCTKENKSEAKR